MGNENAKMMKAIRIHTFGGPEVLKYEDVPCPTVGLGEVLIRVLVQKNEILAYWRHCF
jgi:D-arabinose 1-dehydrogenase-like Zn-dependent alcohol dehydrogenase